MAILIIKKTRLRSLIFVIPVMLGMLSCSRPFRELDKAIRNSAEYEERYRHTQDSLHNIFSSAESDSEKFAAALQLHDRYSFHKADSCIKYANELLSLSGEDEKKAMLAKIYLIRIYSRVDSLEKARVYYQSIDAVDIPEDLKSKYYYASITFHKRADSSNVPSLRKIIDDWWKVDSLNLHCLYFHSVYYPERTDESLYVNTYLKSVENPSSPNMYAMANHGLGMYFLKKGDNQKAKGYLAKAAETDLKVSINGHSALSELAKIVLKEGDVKRAVKYIRVADEGNRFYNYVSHFVLIDKISSSSKSMLLQKERRTKAILYITNLLIALLFSTSVLILVRIRKRNMQIIEQSSIIDGFLGIYLENSVHYLHKVDDYRMKFKKLAISVGVESAISLLRMPSYSDSEFPHLLEQFDKAFLGIFPDFISHLNGMMKPDSQMSLSDKDSMNTKLRILALIRLGISDRRKIAKLLNVSPATVYTYINDMKGRSLFDSKNFDSAVLQL